MCVRRAYVGTKIKEQKSTIQREKIGNEDINPQKEKNSLLFAPRIFVRSDYINVR